MDEQRPRSVLEVLSQPEKEPDERGVYAHVTSQAHQQAALVPEGALLSGTGLLEVDRRQEVTGTWSHG